MVLPILPVHPRTVYTYVVYYWCVLLGVYSTYYTECVRVEYSSGYAILPRGGLIWGSRGPISTPWGGVQTCTSSTDGTFRTRLLHNP